MIQIQAQQIIFDQYALTQSHIESALSLCHSQNIDFADLYFQVEKSESWALEDSIVNHGSFHVRQGLSARVIAGEKVGFAYADAISPEALKKAVNTAKQIAKTGGEYKHALQLNQSGSYNQFYTPMDPLTGYDSKAKVKLLEEIDQFTRGLDARIQKVSASLSGSFEIVWIAATDGTFIGDIRPLVRLNVSVITEQGDRRESGVSGGGGRYGYEQLFAPAFWQHHAKEAVRQASLNLEAQNVPARKMDVVLGANGEIGCGVEIIIIIIMIDLFNHVP